MRRRAILFVIGLLLAPAMSRADEIILKNGDRLTGTVIRMADDVLTVKTPYADDLKLKAAEVKAIRTDKPMHLDLKREHAPIALSDFFFIEAPTVDAGSIGEGSEYPLDRIRSINVPPVQFTGNATLGGNSTRGNTQTTAINAAARLSIRSHRQRVNIEGKYNYGEAGSAVTARNGTGGLEYNLFVSPQTYVLGTGLWEIDTFQSLLLRQTITAGAGYQFIETERAKLSTEGAVAYVREEFRNLPINTTPSTRLAVRWDFALIPGRVVLWQRLEGFHDLDARSATRVRSDQGIRITVYENLFFNLEQDFRYNSRPAPGRKTSDSALIFGIGYAFQ